MKNRPISIRLTEEEVQKLDQIAKEEERTRSSVINRIIREVIWKKTN